MTIEFKIENEDTILLRPFRISDINHKLLFHLIDESKEPWIKFKIEDQSIEVFYISPKITDSEEIINSKLDELYLDIAETEKSGTDIYDEGGSLELNPYDPEKIKVRSDKIPVTLISQMIDDGDIDISPDFQRNLVWNSLQKSRLIESILLRIPLPMFYFAEDKDGKISVVDGLQRISTIKEFMDNKFPLKNLQYLEENCGGKYYQDDGKKKGIDSKYFRWFNLTNLSANIIDPTSPYKVKYDIFRRINTGGRPLNNQEIRNCLTGQGLREVLKEMVALPEFKSATDNSIKNTRMDDHEIALRFLTFYEMVENKGNIEEYSGYMDSTLDDYTEKYNKIKKQDLEEYVLLFSNAMKNAEFLIGRKHAFRKILPKDLDSNAHKQLLNKALFVCTSILLANFNHDKIKKLNTKHCLQEHIAARIEKDEYFFYYLSYGTNGKANLIYTYTALKELFEKHINY